MTPIRVPVCQEGSHPDSSPREIAARESSFIEDVHLMEEGRRFMAGKGESSRKKRLCLKEVAIFVMISGGQISKGASHPSTFSERNQPDQEGQSPCSPIRLWWGCRAFPREKSPKISQDISSVPLNAISQQPGQRRDQ